MSRDVSHALRDAERASDAAGVVIVDAATADGALAVCRVFDRIWRLAAGSVWPEEVARMNALTGQYLVLAHDRAPDGGPGEILGASTAVFAAPAGRALHSHITGVLPAGLGRAVGYAVKLHQRAWALERGIGSISWTFDPLIRRNAWFNLAKLGARPARYLVDFYGAMPDEINAGDATDRLYLHWRLTAPHVARLCAGRPDVAEADALRARGFADRLVSDGEAPRAVRVPAGAAGELVALPADVERLRREDLPTARAWRAAVREALCEGLDGGRSITGITRDGCYILESTEPEPRPEPAEPAAPVREDT
jgi:predicted GNAT superfamily acetyltransferase